MNRRELINLARALALENRKYSELFVELPVEKFNLPGKHPGFKKYPVRAWRSNRFCVQLFDEKPGLVRLTINRTQIDHNGHWLDGITWEELQEIKTQVGYGDYDAVEVFPANKDLMFFANMRHLFVFDAPLDFVWRNQ